MAKLPDSVTGARIVGERFLRSRQRANPDGRMPLVEHIRELRSRLLKALLGIALGMIVGFVFFGRVWKFLMGPYCHTFINHKQACTGGFGQTLVVNGVLDGFYLHVKIALIVGLIVSSPVWLYQLWAFVAPGLYRREKRWTYVFIGSALPLFGLGLYFAYLAMSRGLHFLIAMVPNGATALFTVDTYISYVLAMVLGFGVAFELPLLLVMLNMVGILSHERFRKWRRLIIFGMFLFAGIASPSPDPFTMLILGGVCTGLVEVAEFIVWLNDRRRARIPSPYAGLSDDEVSPLDLPDHDRTPDPR